MSKFIELTLAGSGCLKVLANTDGIAVVDGVNHARIIDRNGSDVTVEESYDTVKSLLIDEKNRQKPMRVTAEEIKEAFNEFPNYCHGRDCDSCKYSKYGDSGEDCEIPFLADYLNGKSEGK